MSVIQEFKCPCCGGAISFDSQSQKMKCPYCDTEFETEALLAYDEVLQADKDDQMEWDTDKQEQWNEGEAEGFRSYICKSCGGEIIGDETTAATTCPFCGNPVVMMNQLSGVLKPDIVIPFRIDKKTAKNLLNEHYKGKKLLPKVFSEQNHIDEIKGIYVPVWLFDTDTDANVRFRATKVRFFSRGDYDYTETSHYSVLRSGSLGFSAIPVDGSQKMPDEIMESIEPYDLSQAVDFQTAYLAGYFADKYDVSAKESTCRANERVKASVEQAFTSTVHGFSTVSMESSDVHFTGGKVRYALYPVWLLNTSWNGNQYKFAINGQTGKIAGDLPIDKSLKRKYFWLSAGISAGIAMALQILIWFM